MSGPTTTAGEPVKRARLPRLATRPLGLHTEAAPPHGNADALAGTVSAGWLRKLVRSIPKDVPDDASVTFSDDHTAVA